MRKKLKFLVWGSLFIGLIFGGFASTILAQEGGSSFIVVDMGGNSNRQKVYIYNQGRLETEILPDNSMVQYIYDANGNVLKRSKGYSSEPYVFSTSAVSYDVYLKNVPDSVQQVHFPTWTELSGQDDIEWIAGEKITQGAWRGTIVFSKHGGQTGTYITHIYADGKAVSGVKALVQDTLSFNTPQEVSLADEFYEISVEGVARNVREIRFPTWTINNGQDDLVNPWIIGEKVNDTTWKIRVPFSKHNFETGNYITHFYSFDKYGNMAGIGGTSVNVKGGTGGSKETDISGVSYDVFIYGVDPKVESVQFPTWTASKDQDDLEWIKGVKIANGVWKGTVVYSKHNSETGRYITHIYANSTFIGGWEFNVTNSLTVKSPSATNISSGFYELSIEGVPSSVKEVRFPTWTSNNGQDDLEWLQGEHVGTNSWKVQVPFNKHNNEIGAYITHIYAYDAYGNNRYIGGATVNVSK